MLPVLIKLAEAPTTFPGIIYAVLDRSWEQKRNQVSFSVRGDRVGWPCESPRIWVDGSCRIKSITAPAKRTASGSEMLGHSGFPLDRLTEYFQS